MNKTDTSSNQVIVKCTNMIMLRGKKSKAEKIMQEAFEEIKKQGHKNPEEVFMQAVSNVTPILEVKSARIGGSAFQIPREVTPKRKTTLPLRWIIDSARARKGSHMGKKLAQELLDASENQGNAVKKKEDVHKMAEANKAFAHFAKYTG